MACQGGTTTDGTGTVPTAKHTKEEEEEEKYTRTHTRRKRDTDPQKSSSRVKILDSTGVPTPAFLYSPTRFSKKFVFPCREIRSIKSKGLRTLYNLGLPNDN